MPETSASDRDLDHVAAELVAILPALNRVLERRAVRDFPHPRLPEGQLALLRLLHERDGITVREAGDALPMKPNNVSDHVTGALHALTDGQRRALGSAVGALSALTERLRDTAD